MAWCYEGEGKEHVDDGGGWVRPALWALRPGGF
jgi:hypothetical protein